MIIKQAIDWHFYDQNLYSCLATHPSANEVVKFVETLNQSLAIDLFEHEPGFHVVSIPSSFLEAIGITTFPNAWNEISSNLIVDANNIRTLPKEIVRLYEEYFSRKSEISRESLIAAAKRQITHTTNPIVVQIVEEIIQFPLARLENTLDGINYHKFICAYLALEHVQKVPYYELLSKIYPNNKKRIEVTRQLYHDFFSMAVDTLKKGVNISYFRSFDKARKAFSLFGDSQERTLGRKFQDPYSKAHLKNKKDLNDSYLIHFALCGIYLNCTQAQRVLCFTLDNPEIIRARLLYAKTMLEWVNKVLDYRCPFCPGIVYCFDRCFEIKDVIQIKDIATQIL